MANPIQRLLTIPLLLRLRRNHALEHATIHLLTRRYPRSTLLARSDVHGFFLFGQVPTETVRSAAQEALVRLQRGEQRLALHPNCGTNFLLAGVLAAAASFVALLGRKDRSPAERLGRLPLAILASVVALIVAQPLGMTLQKRVTTEPQAGSLTIVGVRRLSSGKVAIHRILTSDANV